MLSKYFNLLKNIKIKFLFIFLTLLYISLIFLWNHQRNIYPEKILQLKQITDSIKKNSTKVSTGLSIINFPVFSFTQNNFLINAYVWFKYPSGKNLINMIEKFDFKESEIIYKSSPSIEKLNDKEDLAVFQVKVSLKFPDLNHKNYPIGDHRLNIILENTSVMYDKFYFTTIDSNFELSENISISNWRPEKTTVQAGYLETEIKFDNESSKINYPCALFSIDLKNINLRETITLYLAMFGIFLISLLSLLMPLSPYIMRMSAATASVPILILFRTVILQLSPPSGTFNKADFLYFLLVFCAVIILFFHTYFCNIAYKLENLENDHRIKQINSFEKFNALVLYLILILLMSAITYNAISI
ncbi:MAG: hypothetical protein WC436_01440 [Candidatus Babeliales bacterium]